MRLPCLPGLGLDLRVIIYRDMDTDMVMGYEYECGYGYGCIPA